MTNSKWKNRIRFAMLAAMAVWAILAYAELGKYMRDGILFARVLEGRPYVSDFANVYNAAVLSKRCLQEKIDIYDPVVQESSLEQLIAPVKPELPFYLQYPPYFFVLVLPLALFPMNTAWLVWVLLGGILAVLSILRLSKELSKQEQLIAVILVMSSYPAWLSIELGQTSLVLMPALSFCLLHMQSRGFLSGVISSLVMIKLQYYPILGLLGLAAARWRFLGGALTGGLALVTAGVCVLGLSTFMNYPKALLGGETGAAFSGVSAHSMQNIRGQLVLCFLEDSTLVRQIAVACFIGAATFSAWLFFKVLPWLNQKRPEHAFPLVASVAVLVALSFSLHAHTQDYLVASIPCIWLWRYHRDTGRARPMAMAILAWPILSWIFFLLGPIFMLLRIQPFLVWCLMIAGFALKELFWIYRSARSGEQAPQSTSNTAEGPM